MTEKEEHPLYPLITNELLERVKISLRYFEHVRNTEKENPEKKKKRRK